VALNIKRFEELIDRRLFGEAVRSHDLIVPRALWTAARLVEADRLGVVVVDLALAYGHDGAAARLVTMVIVQANLTEGRHAHLGFKSGVLLSPLLQRLGLRNLR
jgi:hypothetical protein